MQPHYLCKEEQSNAKWAMLSETNICCDYWMCQRRQHSVLQLSRKAAVHSQGETYSKGTSEPGHKHAWKDDQGLHGPSPW
jgi:hypothetical protein